MTKIAEEIQRRISSGEWVTLPSAGDMPGCSVVDALVPKAVHWLAADGVVVKAPVAECGG